MASGEKTCPFESRARSATGLSNGERLDIETRDGEIVIRRAVPHFILEKMFRGRDLKSGGQLMPEPLIGGLMSAVRSSRNDGFGLFARHGRSNWTDCDRTKGREQAGPCGFSSRAHREHRPRDRLSGHVARAAVPPSVVPAWSLPIAGEILTSRIRSIDTPGPANPLCRRCRVGRERPARPGEAQQLHHDLRVHAEGTQEAGCST